MKQFYYLIGFIALITIISRDITSIVGCKM